MKQKVRLDALLEKMVHLVRQEAAMDPRGKWNPDTEEYEDDYRSRDIEDWTLKAARTLLEACDRDPMYGCIMCQS